MDLRGSIPTFVRLTDGRVHDLKVMDKIPAKPNAYYLMDKGYVKFDALYKHFHLKNAYFVTRAKDNMVYEVLERRKVHPDAGSISDQTIRLTAVKTSSKYPDTLRLVVYEDFSTGVVYRFLSNNFQLEALTIADLYRERWQIELFFKWIKQHLHVKTFYGTSMNTVFTQIWIAICDYLLLIIAKKRFMLEPSLHTISNSIGQILFKRGNIRDIFNQPTLSVNAPESELVDQLSLWKISPDSYDIEKYRDRTNGRYFFDFHKRYTTSEIFVSNMAIGLKRVGEVAKIDAPISTYYARHSWATIARNKCKISKSDIDECLNHVNKGDEMVDVYVEKDWSMIDESNRKVLDHVFISCNLRKDFVKNVTSNKTKFVRKCRIKKSGSIS
ncbi:MAG: IS4 family transposase [Paludibacter sp.]|nr:IS4 family transposase [Paludibacter sp.]